LKVQLIFGELVEKEVKTKNKTFKTPAWEPLFETPQMEIYDPDDVESLKDWAWKVNGLIRSTNFQIVVEEGES